MHSNVLYEKNKCGGVREIHRPKTIIIIYYLFIYNFVKYNILFKYKTIDSQPFRDRQL